MSILDRILGRTKQAAGDLADKPSLGQHGREQERNGEAKEEPGRAEERVEQKAQEVADLDGTSPLGPPNGLGGVLLNEERQWLPPRVVHLPSPLGRREAAHQTERFASTSP
jgi:uncharacterized protein YjbJ (UPF0337 family)